MVPTAADALVGAGSSPGGLANSYIYGIIAVGAFIILFMSVVYRDTFRRKCCPDRKAEATNNAGPPNNPHHEDEIESIGLSTLSTHTTLMQTRITWRSV